MPNPRRRGFLRTIATLPVLDIGDWIPDWFEGESTESNSKRLDDVERRLTNLEHSAVTDMGPAGDIAHYPLAHGEDVDTPGGVHHIRPSVGTRLEETADDVWNVTISPGKFLVEAADGTFDVNVVQEIHEFTMTATGSGTKSVSLSGAYDFVTVGIRLPVSDSVLTDVKAKVDSVVTDSDGNVSGVKVTWNNTTTSDETVKVAVTGFR